MYITDTLTDIKYMTQLGIVRSIAKTTKKTPSEVFTGLAVRAAFRTTQLLGVKVQFDFDGLTVKEEHVPTQIILDKYRESLLQLAKVEAGIA